MNQHEIIIVQQKIYEVISLICHGIKKIRFENNCFISQIIITSSQKIWGNMINVLYYKKIGSKIIIPYHLKQLR